MNVFPTTDRLMWYAVCVPEPDDPSQTFVIGYDTGRNNVGYGYAESLITEFFKTDRYKELKKEHPNIKCHTSARSDSRLWYKMIGRRADEVWAICEMTEQSPRKVLSALLHKQYYRMKERAEKDWLKEHDIDELDEDEEIPCETSMDWLNEKDAMKCAADVLSQAMWAWYRFPESERISAIARDRELDVFRTYYNHMISEASITAMYLFPNAPRKKYVGYVKEE